MTPAAPILGDDCGMGLAGKYSAGTSGAVTEHQHKCPTGMDARDLLHDASSQAGEAVDWNELRSFRADEGAGPSALQGRLLELDLNPSNHQGTLSETPSSRHLFSMRNHDDGDREPHSARHLFALPSLLLDNFNTAPSASSERHLSPFEDAMDMSDADAHPPDLDEHPAAQRLASTIPAWDGERPCRANPNSNHDMALFLSAWRVEYEYGNMPTAISSEVMNIRERPRPSVISNVDVAEDEYDLQGIAWASYATNISEVKSVRSRYHQHPHIRQYQTPQHARTLPQSGRVFSFQQTITSVRPWIEHYQLRNLVATTSYNDVYYVAQSKVMSINPSNPQPYCVMDLETSSDPFQLSSDFHITALAAAGPALIAGGFRGEFAIQDLMSEFGTEPVTGYISNHPQAITNHIHTFNSRSNSYPLAAFCSNDKHFRTLDLTTNRLISNITYDDVMNCAATSPDGRLRILTGDFEGAVVADADSGRILEHANGGSRGHGFACAWADNDIHVATAGQDCQVLVWDARNWAHSLAAITTDNSYAASLRFSPLGGGSPVLIAAETADTVSIIDARTYETKQTIDLLGDIAGTALSADGAQLTVAAGDRHLGGLLTFRRSNFGVAHSGSRARRRLSSGQRSDWLGECRLASHPRVRLDAKARRRRGLRLDDMYI